MRGKYFLALSAMLLSLNSCDFEQEFGDGSVADFSDVSVDLNVSAADDCAAALGGFGNDAYLNSRICDNGNVYVYYSGNGSFAGVDSTGFEACIPSVQSGKLEDLKDDVLYYSWVRKDALQRTEEGGSVKSVAADVKMEPAFALLKINVPSELKARNVSMKANIPVTGSILVQPQKGWGSWGESGLMFRPDGDGSDVITISESDGYVDGDVYVAVLPDRYDPANDVYTCSAENLTFSCTYYEGDLTHRYTFDEGIACGTIADLGQIPMPKPKVPVAGGKIRMMPDATLTIGIADANKDCEYYYEIAATESECAKPTTASAKFDPAVGFKPEITGNFDRYYIKVLAHALDNAYSDVVLTASLRNWRFREGCPVDEVLSQMESGAKLPAIGDTQMTSHGLELRRNTLKAAGNYDIGPYEANTSRIAYTTARVQINAITEYASDAWIGFFVDRNTSVKVGSARGYRLYYNNSQNTSDYWTDSVTSEASTSERINMCLHLTDIFKDNGIKAGDKFGLRGDGKHVYYGMALLEVL